jgi:AsmA protein
MELKRTPSDAVVPAIGALTGSGAVSSSGALNFNMVAALSSSGALGGVSGIQRVTGGGSTKIPFAIQGTTSDPRFIPNVGSMAASAATEIVKSKAGNALQNTPLLGNLGGLLGRKPK